MLLLFIVLVVRILFGSGCWPLLDLQAIRQSIRPPYFHSCKSILSFFVTPFQCVIVRLCSDKDFAPIIPSCIFYMHPVQLNLPAVPDHLNADLLGLKVALNYLLLLFFVVILVLSHTVRKKSLQGLEPNVCWFHRKKCNRAWYVLFLA